MTDSDECTEEQSSMLPKMYSWTSAGVALLALQQSVSAATVLSHYGDDLDLVARGMELHSRSLAPRYAPTLDEALSRNGLVARELLGPALHALARRSAKGGGVHMGHTPSAPSAPSPHVPSSEASNQHAMSELPQVPHSSDPVAGARPSGSRNNQQDADKLHTHLMGTDGPGPHHNWKDSALPGQKKPKGQAATADSERVAHEAMAHPGAGGHDQSQDNWQLR